MLAASCIRRPTPGMKVKTASERADDLAQDGLRAAGGRPARARGRARPRLALLALGRPDRRSTQSRFPARDRPAADDFSHPAMAVQLDACIHCNLCVRACREVQVNDVIGMAGARASREDRLRLRRPDGRSTCVACGECVQACPTGALMPKTSVDERGRATSRTRPTARSTASARIAASAASSPTRSRTTASSAVDGRDGPGEPEPALRQGPLRLRLRPPPGPADRRR